MKNHRSASTEAVNEVSSRRRAAGNGESGNAPAAESSTTPVAAKERKPDIGLSGAQRHAVVEILNSALADAYVLHTKSRNYHWNVSGPEFLELHKFLEHQYESLSEAVDEIAERVRVMGGRPVDTLAGFLARARLAEPTGEALCSQSMIADLLADHEAVCRQLRKDIDACADDHKDAGTAEFLTGLLIKHETTAWILRSQLAEDCRA